MGTENILVLNKSNGDQYKLMTNKLELIQSKDGITLYRTYHSNKDIIIKHYENISHSYEIACYKYLAELGMRTIKVIESGLDFLIMEDINNSTEYRLGVEEDLNEINIAIETGTYFKNLHDKTENRTNELITKEYLPYFLSDNVQSVLDKLDNFLDRELLLQSIPRFNEILKGSKKVLIHRDFYYKNFVVSPEGIIMFDFNNMCWSLRSVEIEFIRKVFRQRSEKVENAFLSSYGDYNSIEYKIYELYNHLDCLYYAFQQSEFPVWGISALEYMKNLSINDIIY